MTDNPIRLAVGEWLMHLAFRVLGVSRDMTVRINGRRIAGPDRQLKGRLEGVQ